MSAVTAGGEVRRVDGEHDPDLFWALRGGGGSFALVTAIEFRLYPVDKLYAGALFYPFEKGAEVLHAWHEWTRTAPEEVTTSARLLQFPPLDDLPELVRGQSFAIVDGAFLGSEEDGVELLRPLRELGPQIDNVAMVAPAALPEMHMDPIEPIPWLSTHALLESLSGEAIDEAAEVAKDAPVPIFELRHTGGALARGGPDHGPLDSVAGEYALFACVPVIDPAQLPEIEAGLARLDGVFSALDVGRFPNFAERPAEVAAMFPAEALERLRGVKAEYDPQDVIRANHQITAEG
jgi:hypothetical protein